MLELREWKMTCGKKPVPFEEYIRQGFTSLRQCLLMSKWGGAVVY